MVGAVQGALVQLQREVQEGEEKRKELQERVEEGEERRKELEGKVASPLSF